MMKHKLVHIVIAVLLAIGGTCLAHARACDPNGTWIGGGGSVPSYRLTVSLQLSGRYSVEYQQLYTFSSADFGYPWFTTWQGEWHKIRANRYEAYAFFNNQITPEIAAIYADMGIILTEGDLTIPELDGIWGHVMMLDCNTLRSTIEWYGVYIPLSAGKIAFVTPPDGEIIQDFNGGTPIVETYHRVGPDCPACSSSNKPTGKLAPSRQLAPGWRR